MEKIYDDYKNTDYLKVTVLREKFEEVNGYYITLGYRQIEIKEDKVYGNLLHLVFARPHNIENKDRLQYLQVKLESHLNALSRNEEKRHTKSLVVSLSIAVIVVALVTIGLSIAFNINAKSGLIVFGTILTVIGFFVGVSAIRPIVKIYQKEKVDYQVKLAKNQSEITLILEEIKRLVKINEE